MATNAVSGELRSSPANSSKIIGLSDNITSKILSQGSNTAVVTHSHIQSAQSNGLCDNKANVHIVAATQPMGTNLNLQAAKAQGLRVDIVQNPGAQVKTEVQSMEGVQIAANGNNASRQVIVGRPDVGRASPSVSHSVSVANLTARDSKIVVLNNSAVKSEAPMSGPNSNVSVGQQIIVRPSTVTTQYANGPIHLSTVPQPQTASRIISAHNPALARMQNLRPGYPPQSIAPRTHVQVPQGVPGSMLMENGGTIMLIQNQVSVMQPIAPAPVAATQAVAGAKVPQGVAQRAPVMTVRPVAPGAQVIRPGGLQPSAASPRTSSPHQPHQPRQQGYSSPQMDTMKKCKQFFTTLMNLANQQSDAGTVRSVVNLIQGLIDGHLVPETFTENLRKALNSNPQPNLVPFLKRSLPLLRHAMFKNFIQIEHIRPPPQSGLPQRVNNHRMSAQQPQVIHRPQMVPRGAPGIRPAVVRTIHPHPSHAPQQHAQQAHLVHRMPISAAGSGAGQRLQRPAGMPAVRSHPHQLKAAGAPGQVVQQRVQRPLAAAPRAPQPQMHKVKAEEPPAKKAKYESHIKEDDDINDVAAMGGVNLSEESKNILASTSGIGREVRSCHEESFLNSTALAHYIQERAAALGISDVNKDVLALVSQGTQERLRGLIERLSVITEHRMELYKLQEQYEPGQDPKAQLKVFDELDRLEEKRHAEMERQMLFKAAKSRSKNDDPDHAKIKQRAREMQMQEMEEVRQREANLTALAAIGNPRKKKLGEDSSTAGNTGSPGSHASGNSKSGPVRQRRKRVNMRDLLHVLEQDEHVRSSSRLFRAYLK